MKHFLIDNQTRKKMFIINYCMQIFPIFYLDTKHALKGNAKMEKKKKKPFKWCLIQQVKMKNDCNQIQRSKENGNYYFLICLV